MKPTFFATPAEFRAWFEANHLSAKELLVGFYKRGSGKPSITWPESVDEALCFGWIDGVRKSIDDDAYTIRFTPRRPRSIWSRVNVAHVERLTQAGRMTKAGLAAFAAREEGRTGVYAFEQRRIELAAEYLRLFRAERRAWEHFQSRPPWYQRTSSHWVMSAKREETRAKRLTILIDCSARKQPIPQLAPTPKLRN